MVYGGNGHAGTGGYGPECNFMFPGTSDSLNWGTGCQPPNGPVNWTETTAANNPGDRRGLGSSGPFTFLPGAVQNLDFSFTSARSYTSKSDAFAVLASYLDDVKGAFKTNVLPDGTSFNGIQGQVNAASELYSLYPNPSKDIVRIRMTKPDHQIVSGQIITGSGSVVRSFVINPYVQIYPVDISDLPTGFYLVRLQTSSGVQTKKLSISR
jgi:hypothetical protein